MMGKRYFKYGLYMSAISAMSTLLYGYAVHFFGNFWIITIETIDIPLGVIMLWALFSGSMFFIRYGMITKNRPCSDCPLRNGGETI